MSRTRHALMFFFLFVFSVSVHAAESPHPVILFDKGEAILQRDQSVSDLTEARTLFLTIINKFPGSPLGYLGMSKLYRLQARQDLRYDIETLKFKALPFAVKAMQLGPSIKAVHENYAFFRVIFEDHVRKLK
ncbi:MAG: hypothetical protein ACLFPX_01700 [Candidatus Omnitrophota bacterium]